MATDVAYERMHLASDAARQAYQFAPNAYTFEALNQTGMAHKIIGDLVRQRDDLIRERDALTQLSLELDWGCPIACNDLGCPI